jgi:hypothetical protein
MINNTQQHPSSDEASKVNWLRMVLFMSFIPSIYLIGKLITELF